MTDDIFKDFPAEKFQALVGKTVKAVTDLEDSDEGLSIAFTDGSFLDVGFSGAEGSISLQEKT